MVTRTPRRAKGQAQLSTTDESSDEVGRRLDRIELAVGRLGEASAGDNLLFNGFETLIAQLEPLRELSPQLAALPADESARLLHLRQSMARPKWEGGGPLPEAREDVHFIGEVAPDRPRTSPPAGFSQTGSVAP